MPWSPFVLARVFHNDEPPQGMWLYIITQLPPLKDPGLIISAPLGKEIAMALPQTLDEQEFHHCFLPSLQFSGETFEKQRMNYSLGLVAQIYLPSYGKYVANNGIIF